MSRLTYKELLMKTACMVCCPLCDEQKCVGRFNCKEIQTYIEAKLAEMGGGCDE